MRVNATKVITVLALGGVLLSASGCLGGGEKTAACKNMQTTINGIAGKASAAGTDTAAAARVYADAATSVRSEGKKAGGDVETSANKVATALDGLAASLRAAAAGTPKTPDTGSLISAGRELQDACNS
jgi:hypothetical protein